jgi:hypothetical protein
MHWEHLSALTIHLREFSQDIRKEAKMVISFWGGSRKSIISRTWSSGEKPWEIGDRVDDDNLPTGGGVVMGIRERQIVRPAKDMNALRVVYEIEHP